MARYDWLKLNKLEFDWSVCKKNTSLSVVTGQGLQLGHIFVSVESTRRPSSGDDSGSEFQSEDLDSERDRDKKQVRLIFVRNPVMCLVDL